MTDEFANDQDETTGTNGMPPIDYAEKVAQRTRDKDALPSRREVVALRHKEQEGVPFKLDYTGGTATVKMPSITDRAFVLGLPTSFQRDLLAEINRGREDRGDASMAIDLSEFMTNREANERLADQLCVAGFIRPRLVATERELDGSDHCWVVTDLHPNERLRYLDWFFGNNEEAKKKAAVFLRQAVADRGPDEGRASAESTV